MNEYKIQARKLIDMFINSHSNINTVCCAKEMAIINVNNIIESIDNISSFIEPSVFFNEKDFWEKVIIEINETK